MISEDLRWRAVVLSYIYGIESGLVCDVLGISISSIKRWTTLFVQTGTVVSTTERQKKSRYSTEVLKWIDDYALSNPCFYIEELQTELRTRFPFVKNTSVPTLCRALKFDLKLSKKVLTKRAREATVEMLESFYLALEPFYQTPDQVVFVDETAKDNRATIRKMAWSRVNSRALVNAKFERGKRISFLAAMDVSGFIAVDSTTGTFDRAHFHQVMTERIIPLLNPYPLPRSILVIDNAKIHYYPQLLEAVHRVGALIFFLPPYCPYLNPIELGFSYLKGWIQKYAHLSFKHNQDAIGRIAFHYCTRENGHKSLEKVFASCGYERGRLVRIQ